MATTSKQANTASEIRQLKDAQREADERIQTLFGRLNRRIKRAVEDLRSADMVLGPSIEEEFEPQDDE